MKVGRVRVQYDARRRKRASFKVQTPRGSASVRGTDEVVSFTPDRGMETLVLKGHVDVESLRGILLSITEGKKTVLKAAVPGTQWDSIAGALSGYDDGFVNTPEDTIIDFFNQNSDIISGFLNDDLINSIYNILENEPERL